MCYKPIFHQINETNVFDLLYKYLETWHEMEISVIDKKMSFHEILKIEISSEINDLLNFLMALNFTTVYGKKKYIYNGFEYVFPMQILNITYDKKKKFLSIFKEYSNGKSRYDLHYGIKKEHFLEKNPKINRLYKNDSTKTMEFSDDLNLSDFIVYNICWSASKIGVKEYSTFLESNMKIEIESLKKIFKYETKFNNFELLENDNLTAMIDHRNGMNILRINKWEEKEKFITEEIIKIFNWDGWSNNCLRYKL